MFNGIIKNTGRINKISLQNSYCYINVSSKMKFYKDEIGSSISCSGTCLTVEKCNKNSAQFYLSKETLDRTNFKKIKKGVIINLEKSLRFNQRISGHFVQGHVDTTSVVKNIITIGKSWIITFSLKNKYNKFIVHKGSITINGISLTISKIIKKGFQITVIPKTLKLTNLIYLKKNDLVNVEFDILGKYLNSLIKRKWSNILK